MSRKRWTKREIDYMERYYAKFGADELAKIIKRTRCAVINFACKSGLTKQGPRFWSKEDEKFLVENFEYYSCKELAKLLNRSESAVRSRAASFGLRKQRVIPSIRGETKRCYVCKEFKPFEKFHRSRKVKHNRDAICKSCKSLADKNSRVKKRTLEKILTELREL